MYTDMKLRSMPTDQADISNCLPFMFFERGIETGFFLSSGQVVSSLSLVLSFVLPFRPFKPMDLFI